MDWFRSYHGAPFDPKFRVIAKSIGVRTGEVAVVFWALLDYASQAEKRGVTHSNALQRSHRYEEISAAFDFDVALIESIYSAFESRGMIVDGTLIAWEKRQPKREDDSTFRVRAYRERVRETQRNADETHGNSRLDKSREDSLRAQSASVVDLKSELFGSCLNWLASLNGGDPNKYRSVMGRWVRDYGEERVLQSFNRARKAATPVGDPVAWMQTFIAPKRRAPQI